MTDEALNHPHNPWGRKQWCIFGGVFFTLLIVIPAGLFISPIWDEPLMDDAVLRCRPTPMPAEENAFEEVEAAMASLVMPPEDQFDLFWNQPETFREELLKWIQQNQLFFKGMDRARAKGAYQGPWFESAEDLEKLHSFNSFQALNLRTLSFSDPLDRIRDRVRQIELGIQIAQGEFHVSRIQEHASISEGAVFQIRHEFTLHPPTPEQLRVLAEEINRLPPVNETYRIWMLRQMYQLDLAKLKAGEDAGTFYEKVNNSSDPFGFFDQNPIDRLTFFYQPRRTRNLLFESYAFNLQQLDPEMIPGELRTNMDVIGSTIVSPRDFLGLAHHFNRSGNRFLEVQNKLWVPMDLMASSWMGQKLILFKTQIALQRYHLDHGQLPESLSQLVPRYLTQRPLDPFTGEDITYFREKQFLYCKLADSVLNPEIGVSPAYFHTHIFDWKNEGLIFYLPTP
ncbi:hypothetical protein P0Y35_10675 [Kiritimatiellaeota bacterium B1221]|nr:hypothetical protein [Kiritimatiellaeota bacterium B1221]